MLGAGVISPFSSFSSLTGAGLFWELQGLRAGETRLMSLSQEVAQREGSSCGTRGEGRLQNTSDRDKRIPEKDASVSSVWSSRDVEGLASPPRVPTAPPPSCHCWPLATPQPDIPLATLSPMR